MPKAADRSNEVLVASGALDVPPGTRLSDFADMEDQFRPVLWPRVAPGFLRQRRELRYSSDGKRLHYAIYDTPSKPGGKG